MQAVILTAGEGTRMRPLTLSRPKTMLPVGGKPILQYNVEALRDVGITEILLIVGYKEEMVKEHFGDGEKIGVKISYITQKERLGTAHSIGHSQGFINLAHYFGGFVFGPGREQAEKTPFISLRVHQDIKGDQGDQENSRHKRKGSLGHR